MDKPIRPNAKTCSITEWMTYQKEMDKWFEQQEKDNILRIMNEIKDKKKKKAFNKPTFAA